MIPPELNGLSEHLLTLPLNTSFDRPLDIQMPEIEVYTAELDQVAQKDDKISYDLKRIADLYQQKKSIFGTINDKIIHDMGWFSGNYSHLYLSSVPAVSFVLSIVSILLSVIVLYKLHILTGVVLYSTVNQVPTVDALGQTPPDWLIKQLETSKPYQTNNGCNTEIIHNTILVAIPLCVIAIFLVIWLIKLIITTYVKLDSHIFLVLFNDENCVHIPIRKLYKCPITYGLKFYEAPGLKINGIFKDTLMITWFNTHLHDKSSQEIIAFPNKARVSIFQRHALLKLLKSSYSVEILFQHKAYNYYPIREDCDCTNGSPDD